MLAGDAVNAVSIHYTGVCISTYAELHISHGTTLAHHGAGLLTIRRTGMTQAVSLCLVGALILNGCSPHRVEPETGPYANSEVQDLVDALEVGDRVHVWLLDGSQKQGRLTCVDDELLCFGRVWISWEQVERIEFGDDDGRFTLAMIAVVGVVLLILTVGIVEVKSGPR